MSEREMEIDGEELVNLFNATNAATEGHQIGVVAVALSLCFATCVLEAMEPGDDLEECIQQGINVFERTLRDAIEGRGPVRLRNNDSN
jgi:hypothetical protein